MNQPINKQSFVQESTATSCNSFNMLHGIIKEIKPMRKVHLNEGNMGSMERGVPRSNG